MFTGTVTDRVLRLYGSKATSHTGYEVYRPFHSITEEEVSRHMTSTLASFTKKFVDVKINSTNIDAAAVEHGVDASLLSCLHTLAQKTPSAIALQAGLFWKVFFFSWNVTATERVLPPPLSFAALLWADQLSLRRRSSSPGMEGVCIFKSFAATA